MKATNIIWDTDGDENILANLPTEIEIPEGITDNEDISDYLSDVTGFCHKGYVLETEAQLREAGYTEPAHYQDDAYVVLGKALDMYHMEFAAAVNENKGEDKQEICNLLLKTLQATRGAHDLVSLKYERKGPDDALVTGTFASGSKKVCDVSMDSGCAMIRDIMKQLDV